MADAKLLIRLTGNVQSVHDDGCEAGSTFPRADKPRAGLQLTRLQRDPARHRARNRSDTCGIDIAGPAVACRMKMQIAAGERQYFAAQMREIVSFA